MVYNNIPLDLYMDLQEFFEKADITKTAFCKKARISYQYLYRILNKKYIPSKMIARRIEEASEHKVLMHEVLNPKKKPDKNYEEIDQKNNEIYKNKIEQEGEKYESKTCCFPRWLATG